MRKLIVVILVLSLQANAWWEAGHRGIAGLAYDNLNKKARARVDEMIRTHPDYNLFIKDAPVDANSRARVAFTRAAVWADVIKNDARFYNDASRNPPTPVLSGFPDMKQHRDWHYIDIPFSQDGTATKPAPVPNALSELSWMIPAMAKAGAAKGSKEDPVYILPWLLHIVGDLHQPLHTTARFRKGQNDANGRAIDDAGGNAVYLSGNTNLHALWDSSLGTVDTNDYVYGLIKSLGKMPKEKKPVIDPNVWVEEGFALAQKEVYSFPSSEGLTKENPYQVPDAYKVRASKVARERAALGGRRLAALLNELLGR